MLSTALILSVLLPHQEVVIRTSRPPLPVVVSTSTEVICRGRRVSIEGLNGWGSEFEGPRIRYNGRRVDISPELADFFVGEPAATFRVSGTCPESGPGVMLIVYRASAAIDGSVSYAIRGIDVERDGRVIDKGSEVTADPDAFWFR